MVSKFYSVRHRRAGPHLDHFLAGSGPRPGAL